jgi:gamma-glutamyltranspeptidase/glutathione hydrolase
MPSRLAPRARPAVRLLPALLALALLAAPFPFRSPAYAKQKTLEPGKTGEPFAPIGALSPHGAVASDSEAASRVATAVLEAGGNAIDAAVAGALALGSAAPGASGLGGNTWILVHAAGGEDVAFVSPYRAPLRVDVTRAKAARQGQYMTGPLAATVPGSVATLARAHARFGTLPWAELVAPAAALAEEGHVVSVAEHAFLLQYAELVEASPSLRPIYLTDDCDDEGLAVPVPVGHRVVFPGLARTLRRLAEAGPDDFYRGAIAAEIAADFARHSAFLRAEDLARVPATIVEASPLRGRYRDLDVLSLPLPGAGSVVIRLMHILQAFPPGLLAGEPWARAQALCEAGRISFADAHLAGIEEEVPDGPDRSRWLDPSWGDRQAGLIRFGRALPAEVLPKGRRGAAFQDRDTTHLSVVDREGNAVSLTQSLGRTWGSMHVTPGLGFPYNAFMEIFDVEDPHSATYLRPNAPARTAVAPTIFLRDGRAALVLGASGSSRIPSAIANVAIGVFDGGLPVAEAVAAPRAAWSEGRNNRGVMLELASPYALEDADLLRAAGYADLQAYAPEPGAGLLGALNAVGWNAKAGAWEAGADPRRGGFAAVPARPPARAPEGKARPR